MGKTVKRITWAGFAIVIGIVFLTAPAGADNTYRDYVEDERKKCLAKYNKTMAQCRKACKDYVNEEEEGPKKEKFFELCTTLEEKALERYDRCMSPKKLVKKAKKTRYFDENKVVLGNIEKAEDKCKKTSQKKFDACAKKKTPQKIQSCINKTITWAKECLQKVHRKYDPQLRGSLE